MARFNEEKDVRKWWRDQAKCAHEEKFLFWVEPKFGSTFGFPDLIVARHGRLILFELKLGTIKDGLMQWKFRQSQAVCCARMKSAGVDVFAFIGIKHTERIAIVKSTEAFLGKTKEWQEISSYSEIWEKVRPGSKFLFSSSF